MQVDKGNNIPRSHLSHNTSSPIEEIYDEVSTGSDVTQNNEFVGVDGLWNFGGMSTHIPSEPDDPILSRFFYFKLTVNFIYVLPWFISHPFIIYVAITCPL